MTDVNLRLSIALAARDHVNALKVGEVTPAGIDLQFVQVEPMIAAYRRMIRSLEFDVCELAPTTYLAARDVGIPLTALPVFINRRFHHGDFVCRPDSGISVPKDLNGRRVGTRAYTVTTAMWARGILSSQYGVDLESITWVVDDEEHVVEVELPPNVEHVKPGDSIATQFARGEIDAALTGAAGIGRSGAPKAGWAIAGHSTEDARARSDEFYPLFQDSRVLEADWYLRTGIYPIHGLLAVKTDVYEANPWIGGSLMEAAAEAKKPFLDALHAGQTGTRDLKQYSAFASVVGDDPLPYGVDKNEASIRAMIDFTFDQHIIRTKPDLEQVFAIADL